MSLKTTLAYIGKRLAERSSWLGLTAIIGSVGVAIAPDLLEVIIQSGIALGGLIVFLTKDKPAAVVEEKK